MANNIRWKKGDYISLGKAVSDFNKKIRELKNEENKLYLPEEISYKEIKENILTRNELNKSIASLKRFKKEGAEELYTTEAGEKMTKWERKELGISSRTAQIKLINELKKLNEPTESGFSRAQMGSLRVKEIQANLRKLKQIETSKGFEFEKLKNQISKYGFEDNQYRKAKIYRENYIEMIKNFKDFDNYDKLMLKLNGITDPVKFWNYISQNELLSDISFMYEMNDFSIGGVSDQDKFNSMLESVGIEIE